MPMIKKKKKKKKKKMGPSQINKNERQKFENIARKIYNILPFRLLSW
jgi:hypothetical protein